MFSLAIPSRSKYSIGHERNYHRAARARHVAISHGTFSLRRLHRGVENTECESTFRWRARIYRDERSGRKSGSPAGSSFASTPVSSFFPVSGPKSFFETGSAYRSYCLVIGTKTSNNRHTSSILISPLPCSADKFSTASFTDTPTERTAHLNKEY